MARKLKENRNKAKHSYFLKTSDVHQLRSTASCLYEIGVNPRNRRAFLNLLKVVQARSTLLAPEEGVLVPESDYVRGIANLALRHDRYLRSPDQWEGGEGNKNRLFASLARHLLTRYKPPGWLSSVWLTRLDARVLMEQEMYCLAGTGQRLRDLNPPMPLTRRMEHFLLGAPDDFNFREALRYAEALALNCSEQTARAFAAANPCPKFEHVEFWRSLMRMFAANPRTLPADQVRPVVDYLRHMQYTMGLSEGGKGARGFSLKGRTAGSLLRLIQAWHMELNAGRVARSAAANAARREEVLRLAAQTWKKSGIEEYRLAESPGSSGEWVITEILQGARLAWEGRVMRHCVASYQARCRQGETTIWSMRFVDDTIEKPALTIQVHPRTRRIQQARGKHNRMPNSREWTVLNAWARREGLLLGKSV